jgi:hypothetical protein
MEERWLNGSAPDCKSVVLGSNPAPPQYTANSVNPEVGSHLGLHSTGSEGWQRYSVYTKNPKNIYEKKLYMFIWCLQLFCTVTEYCCRQLKFK